jgi:hypothetical protein
LPSPSPSPPHNRPHIDVSGTRDVLLTYAAEGQPESARKMALRALASLADDEANREPMWPVCRCD